MDTKRKSPERFDYIEWRCHGLPELPLDEIARLANLEAEKMGTDSDYSAVGWVDARKLNASEPPSVGVRTLTPTVEWLLKQANIRCAN